MFIQGQHVVAEFPDRVVEAIILEVGDGELKVQEKGTTRAEWIRESRCRKL